MTHGHAYGFKVAAESGKEFYRAPELYPKNMCPETKYAEAMIKSGFHR